MPKNSQIIPQILAAIFILLSCWPIFLLCSYFIEMPLTLPEWVNEYRNWINLCKDLIMNIIFLVFIAYFHRRYKSRTTTIAFVFCILWFVFGIANCGLNAYMIYYYQPWIYGVPWLNTLYSSIDLLAFIFFAISISFFAESLKHDTFVLVTTIGLILITSPILMSFNYFWGNNIYLLYCIAIYIAKNMFLFAACLAEAPDAESKIKEHNNAHK